jgi:MFS family permease
LPRSGLGSIDQEDATLIVPAQRADISTNSRGRAAGAAHPVSRSWVPSSSGCVRCGPCGHTAIRGSRATDTHRSEGPALGRIAGRTLHGQADATIANVATPSIHSDLGASGATLELVIGGYLIAFAVRLITGARLGQTHGYRRVFLLGIAVFSLASLLCGFAPSSSVLVGGRVLQGIGAALMFPQTLTGIQLNFDSGARRRAIGLYAVALSMGAVVGQILGGALISANFAGSHWRAIFLINVPVGAVVIAAALRYLPTDEQRTARRLDLPGIATLSVTLLLVVLPLALGRSEGWPAWTWICLAAGAPAFVLFLAVERRITASGGSPLVNLGAFARATVGWALLTLLTATGTYYALSSPSPSTFRMDCTTVRWSPASRWFPGLPPSGLPGSSCADCRRVSFRERRPQAASGSSSARSSRT